MSATNYYQPHVYLNGELLTERAPAAGLAAVADFKISWGAKDWWENVEPSKLDITLLDPHGDLIGKAEQQPIQIRRDPDNSIVFTGNVDEVKSRYETRTDPRTGKPRDMWVHHVRAYCPLAQLARDRRRGVTYNSRDIDPYRLHWGPCYLGERKDAISTRSPVPIRWGTSALDSFDDVSPLTIYPLSAYERQQIVSLLTVLRNTARIYNPLNRPYFFHSQEMINFVAAGSQPRNSGTRPAYVHEIGSVELRPTNTGLFVETLIPGGEVSMKSGVSTSSALREQMTHLEITSREARASYASGTDPHMEVKEYSHGVQAALNYTNQMTLQIDIDASTVYYESYLEDQFRDDAISAMRYTYGSASFEPLEYKFAKHEAAPEWALPWLTPEPPMETVDKPRVYHLIASLTNWVPTARPFSIVGGVLTYTHRHGWKASLNTAPSRKFERQLNYKPNPPYLGELMMTQPISNVTDNSFIADWQQISQVNT